MLFLLYHSQLNKGYMLPLFLFVNGSSHEPFYYRRNLSSIGTGEMISELRVCYRSHHIRRPTTPVESSRPLRPAVENIEFIYHFRDG